MSASPIRHRPRVTPVARVDVESSDVRTIWFRDEACLDAQPGQFVMVWVPGVDEVPMSLSAIDVEGLSAITVKRVGEATEGMHRLSVGDLIGVRGPYGRGFTVRRGRCLAVAGGIGVSTIVPLVERLSEAGAEVTVVYGAKTRDELVLLDRLRESSDRLIVLTEDGSFGLRGVATDPLDELLDEGFDIVYTCGPEAMMHTVFLKADRRGIPVEACLERIMRCCVGICGSCVVDGVRLCVEGPVLGSETLRRLEEFGRFRREFSGRLVRI